MAVLLRPVQHFGRLTSIESVDLPMGGKRMTGHNYATLLDVPAVFSAETRFFCICTSKFLIKNMNV